jgi:hypothetical protein
MTRKILFIIIGALLFLALLALLWFWFLHRSPAADTGSQASFATSTDRDNSAGTAGTAGGGSGGNDTNASGTAGDGYTVTLGSDGYLITSATGQGLPAPGTYRISQGGRAVGTYAIGTSGIGKYALTPQSTTGGGTLPNGSYTFIPISVDTVGSGIDIGTRGTTTPNTTGSNTTTQTSGTNTGAWLGSNVSERIFSPGDIAGLNDPGNLGGTPLISTTPQAAGLGTSGLVLGLTAAGCVAQQAVNKLLSNASDVNVSDVSVGVSVLTYDFKAATQRAAANNQTLMQCIVKSIAQAAIDQITRSIVTWINSGFNGQPSFVTNFNQYFASVADQAAGEFIKGSALSFLCSPFAPQIKIAIAQSYANRNAGASCSLTKITNNVNGFLRGNWGAGGWGGLLQFTTMPTNNPYGAYAYAQLSLNATIASAQNNANRNVSPGGFISVQKCETPQGPTANGSAPKQVCKVTTPGQVIQDSLKTSQDSSINQLNIAQDINSIVNALTNQLILKTLYGGLANANNGITNPLAPAVDQAASAQAQALLANLQAGASYALQYGSVKQGSASDIQQVQQNFNTVFNCWETAASSTALSADQQAQAAQSANSADAQILQLQAQVDALNGDITRANAAMASVQNLQSQVLFAATPQDIDAATYAIQAAGPSLIAQADITTAQQDRAALQTGLTATNSLAQAGLAQCRALGV